MRIDGISGRSERPPERHIWTPNYMRLSNKSYALQRPMAKLVLLQQLGISVPEIYSSKNLPLVTPTPLEPLLCSAEKPHRRECKTHHYLTPPILAAAPQCCVPLSICQWTQSPSPRCLLAGSS